MRVRWRLAVGALLVGGCTPLGLWLYEDPVVTVHRVSLQLRQALPAGASPVVVALAVENRNDYPLSAERMELWLRMDGVSIGRLAHDLSAPMAKDTVSTLAMPLALESHATPERLETLGSGTRFFAVRGKATFRTPIGTREVRFAQEGSMVFGRRSSELPSQEGSP